MVGDVFEVKEITTSHEAANQAATLEVYTDMPSWGSAATSLTLPVTTGGKATTPKAVDFECTAFRVKCITLAAGGGGTPAAGTLKMYSATLKVRRLGLYLAGGDTWTSEEVAISA
jgi:hypothetical protein